MVRSPPSLGKWVPVSDCVAGEGSQTHERLYEPIPRTLCQRWGRTVPDGREHARRRSPGSSGHVLMSRTQSCVRLGGGAGYLCISRADGEMSRHLQVLV